MVCNLFICLCDGSVWFCLVLCAFVLVCMGLCGFVRVLFGFVMVLKFVCDGCVTVSCCFAVVFVF